MSIASGRCSYCFMVSLVNTKQKAVDANFGDFHLNQMELKLKPGEYRLASQAL